MAQHVQAFQTDSLIGKDYGGISDNHNMVVVVAKKYGGASEPTGSTCHQSPGGASEPTASELAQSAQAAAQCLANILEDQLRPPARRKAKNGLLYTFQEFLY